MNVTLAVRSAGLGTENTREPVVCNHFPSRIENEAAHGVILVRIRVYTPVRLIQVLVDG